MKDLMQDDDYVIKIIKDKGDESMLRDLEDLKKKRPVENLPKKGKLRFVDPKIIYGKSLKKLSQI